MWKNASEQISMENSHRKTRFTCYFCHETIENESEMGHTSVCSKVLVPCPNKCGSYVARASLPKHQTECVNQKAVSNNHMNYSPKHTNAYSLDRNATQIKTVFQEELAKLSKRIVDLEMRHQRSSPTYQQLIGVTTRLDELKNSSNQQALAIEKINYFNGFLSDWKKNLENQMEILKSTNNNYEKSIKETDVRWKHLQERLIQLEKLHAEFRYFKDVIQKDNARLKNSEMDFARNIEEMRRLADQQASNVSSIWNEYQETMTALRGELVEINRILDEQKAKHTSLVFDLRSVSQIASEAAEKIEIQERDFKELKREVDQIKMDVAMVEGLMATSENDIFGGILWKITEFDSKLKAAKESGIVLKSPVFYTHRYGYKIRILLYLNGLNKWRDRYALACIHVLKGDYDMLLSWPCTIEGNIILKDLENISKPKPFSKFIKAKRNAGDEESEEPQESSSTYIFIPHSVLLKEMYLKNDTIFVEVKINSNEKQETSF